MKTKIKPVSEMTDIEILEFLAEGRQKMAEIKKEIRKVVFGSETDHLIDVLIAALLARTHVMVRADIGLGKTLTCNAFAKTIGGVSRKIQFRPDMLPADISGKLMPNMKTGEEKVYHGPLYKTNILVADEINRTPPKTQSALLEAMEEKEVSIGKDRFPLEKVFLVLATRNPIEHEGTYELPEAQMDRFGFQANIDGWSTETGMLMLADQEYHLDVGNRLEKVQQVVDPDYIIRLREVIFRKIHVERRVHQYIVDICQKTRRHKAVKLGSSLRGAKMLNAAATISAFLEGRSTEDNRVFVVGEDDVRKYAVDVLAHRIFLKDEVRYNNEEGVSPAAIIQEIVENTSVGE